MNWEGLKLFQEARHLAFCWPGGRPAALLVHGFPGTPAEVRPLAELLQPMGWTVEGLLLPGFGAQFATLAERRYDEWIVAILEALEALRARGHGPLLLAGYSMGAALSIAAAIAGQPDGLLLLAPFSWQQSRLGLAAGALLRPMAPSTIRPFRRANLSDPRMRRMVLSALPGIDLDDSQVQASVRDLEVSLSLVAQVFKAGWRAWHHAPEARMPALVVQGTRDEAVPAWRTRGLVQRLGHVVRYVEVDAGHRLIGPDNLAWPTVQEVIMDFAVRLEEQGRL